MFKENKAAGHKAIPLNTFKPYDFALSLRAVRSFQPALSEQSGLLHLATKIDGSQTLIDISQGPEPTGKLVASSVSEVSMSQIRRIAEWVMFAELELAPFYSLIAEDPKLAPITHKLYGLKPIRPISLFEMAIVAIIEQQISLAAAYKIRSRFVQQFGESLGDQWIFPEPYALASSKIEDLRLCGLSRQKAQYIHELAVKIGDGTLNLDILKNMSDEKAREIVMDLKGFGRWSADYILIRGLARTDCIPIDDLAIRSVVGEYLGGGHRLSSLEVTGKLDRFRPYRGLLAFYLLADHRLKLANTG